MRHRTDNNQKSIVDAIRKAGATIKDTGELLSTGAKK